MHGKTTCGLCRELGMTSIIRVAILEDHQSIIDGYLYRLGMASDIQIVGTCLFGSELELLLVRHEVDVLLLDLSVQISQENHNIFPIRHELTKIFHQYPKVKVIVISVFDQPALVRAMFDFGVHGYIVKDDQSSIENLAQIIKVVAGGGVYHSSDLQVYSSLQGQEQILTPRQIEVLSLCVAYPDMSTLALAQKMNITSSTFRNLLSGAYKRLGVRTRQAAVVKAQEKGLIVGEASKNQEHI